ncbi:hypothetical protein, partial, partial [Parasitella parasitica]
IKVILKEGVKLPYVWKNDLVCYQEDDQTVPFIPISLVEQVLYHVHNKPYAGHFGVKKTLDKTREIGWWPNMKTDVQNWVKSCEGCQRFKVRNDVKRPPMKPITPTRVSLGYDGISLKMGGCGSVKNNGYAFDCTGTFIRSRTQVWNAIKIDK